MSAGAMQDAFIRNRNVKAGHTLCTHCNGTGNELYAMYRSCPECENGIAVRYGERPALVRAYLLRRERRQRQRRSRGPIDWNGEIRWRLSRWLGIGDWFHDRRDRCRHCEALPSDVDFEMRRIWPLRAECADADCCSEGEQK